MLMLTRDVLFEIGTEELPSAPLNRALIQTQNFVEQFLADADLAHGTVRVLATPRRIAVMIADVAEAQSDKTIEHRGPALSIAFSEDGTPTKAAQGFARGKGVSVDDLEQREIDGTTYLYAIQQRNGRAAQDVLTELFTQLVPELNWPRSMRWGRGDERFVRPVRWLVALYGEEVLPVTFGHLKANNISSGYRFLDERNVVIGRPDLYEKALEERYVIVNQDSRRASILEGIAAGAAPYGEPLIPAQVLDEVVNLTEWPNALVGTFDEAFLRVPREILETAMSKHQRYFAIERADGTLDNHFVVISNGDEAFGKQIIEGHERVVRARLSDAAFFYDEDLKVPLEDWLVKLDEVVFQEKLGTTGAKVRRMERLAALIAAQAGLEESERKDSARAIHLAKADLVTSAVIEFTEVQGVMGSYYAAAAGENPGVVRAIREQYRPRYSGDAIPGTRAGQVVAVTDKLDTICGIFAVGKAPKGTSDPFALRRAAIGIEQIILQSLNTLDLSTLIDEALAGIEGVDFDMPAAAEKIRAFFSTRLENILADEGVDHETVAAVLAASQRRPADVAARARALQAVRGDAVMDDLSAAFKRARNLADTAAGSQVDRALMQPVECALFDALARVEEEVKALLEAEDYQGVLASFATLREPIDTFFEEVMVMDEDPALRANRLALLNKFVALFERFAHFDKLS